MPLKCLVVVTTAKWLTEITSILLSCIVLRILVYWQDRKQLFPSKSLSKAMPELTFLNVDLTLSEKKMLYCCKTRQITKSGKQNQADVGSQATY